MMHICIFLLTDYERLNFGLADKFETSYLYIYAVTFLKKILEFLDFYYSLVCMWIIWEFTNLSSSKFIWFGSWIVVTSKKCNIMDHPNSALRQIILVTWRITVCRMTTADSKLLTPSFVAELMITDSWWCFMLTGC